MVTISEGIGVGLALAMGFLTSFHCVGMCGGFVVAYTTAHAKPKASALGLHAWYAVGKLVSYGAIGAAFGLLGRSIAISPGVRVAITVAAGLLLVAYGLTSLNVLPFHRYMGAHAPVRVLNLFSSLKGRYRHPLVLGLLSGLMLMCGPLQAMYVAAAGTGSVLQGTLLLLAFAAGTLPLLVGVGIATGFLSYRFTVRAVRISAVVVILLGALMINRGVAMSKGGATHCHSPETSAPISPE
jgi:sulfite exporter TauE/SafE